VFCGVRGKDFITLLIKCDPNERRVYVDSRNDKISGSRIGRNYMPPVNIECTIEELDMEAQKLGAQNITQGEKPLLCIKYKGSGYYRVGVISVKAQNNSSR
jgi:hypothetical protein